MMYYMNLNIKNIANKIFNNSTENCYDIFDNNFDLEMQFEILISIFMEGVMLKFDLDQLDLDTMDADILLTQLKSLDPYIQTIGFLVNVTLDQSNTDDRYCRIIVKNGADICYFEKHNLETNYTFLLNPKVKTRPILDAYFAIFACSNIFNISFTAKM